MNAPAHILLHPAIERDLDALPVARRLGMTLSELPVHIGLDGLKKLEAQITRAGERPVLFCTLKIANEVLRHCPGLARGLSMPRDVLRPSCYGAYLPPQLLLNARSFFLPWGHIPHRAEELKALFPEGVFLRPDSGMKSFTGFSVSHDDLLSEWKSIGTIHAMQPEEMVMASPRKTLPAAEYRVWMLDAEPVAGAAYGWRDLSKAERNIPAEIFEAATIVSQALAMRVQDYTADFVLEAGVPKLVEINGFSTSGWYKDLDLDVLLSRVNAIFL